jgi:type IV secretory pathway TrbD component
MDQGEKMEFLLWLGIVLGLWTALILAALKGWYEATIGITVFIVALHLIPQFYAANMFFVTIQQLRKDVFRREGYFDSLTQEVRADS